MVNNRYYWPIKLCIDNVAGSDVMHAVPKCAACGLACLPYTV